MFTTTYSSFPREPGEYLSTIAVAKEVTIQPIVVTNSTYDRYQKFGHPSGYFGESHGNLLRYILTQLTGGLMITFRS